MQEISYNNPIFNSYLEIMTKSADEIDEFTEKEKISHHQIIYSLEIMKRYDTVDELTKKWKHVQIVTKSGIYTIYDHESLGCLFENKQFDEIYELLTTQGVKDAYKFLYSKVPSVSKKELVSRLITAVSRQSYYAEFMRKY